MLFRDPKEVLLANVQIRTLLWSSLLRDTSYDTDAMYFGRGVIASTLSTHFVTLLLEQHNNNHLNMTQYTKQTSTTQSFYYKTSRTQ